MLFKKEDVLKIINISQNSDGEMFLLIKLTEMCNLNCKYCTLHDNSFKFEHNKEVIINVIVEVLNSIDIKKYWGVAYHIYGGEPTVHHDFINILKEIVTVTKSRFEKFRIEIKTNLKKDISFFKEVTNIHQNIKLCGSYQNHQQNLELFKKKVLELKEEILIIDIMLEDEKIYPSNEKEITNFIYFMKENNLRFQLNVVNDILPNTLKNIYEEFKTEDEQMMVYTKNGNHLISVGDLALNYNNFFGLYCDVGHKQFLINFVKEKIRIIACYSDDIYQTNTIWDSDMDFNSISTKISKSNMKTRCIHRNCYCEVNINKFKRRNQ